MPVFMARTDSDGLQCRRNSKLDSFLKRNTERRVYERIRAYEPCVVISETINKVFMYVVLSDECIYLAEFPPRTVQAAVYFKDVIAIELVNDLPDFLSGRDRERSQHIRIVHASAKHAGKKGARLQGERPRAHPPSSTLRRKDKSISPSDAGPFLSTQSAPSECVNWKDTSSSLSDEEEEFGRRLRQRRAASCPNPDLSGLTLPLSRPLPLPPLPYRSLSSSSPPSPPCAPTSAAGQSEKSGTLRWKRRGSALARLMNRVPAEEGGGEKTGETELHLYAVSPASRIYLHLQSSWGSYVMRSTLLLDPEFRKRRSSTSPVQQRSHISWERTVHLFSQLSRELLQESVALETFYLLLQELHTAAHRSSTVRKLFWRSGDLCPFLVKTLDDVLHKHQSSAWSKKKINRADRLLLSTLVAQTLGMMFRETEIEPARFRMLTAKRGALTEMLLLALVCGPEVEIQDTGDGPGQDSKGLLVEYLDAASALLFEVVVLAQQATHILSFERFLTVGWVLKTLQTHQSILPFMHYLAEQVVYVLSLAVLSPAQAVLLYQRCHVLLACLQYNPDLGQYIRAEFREEFRYYVKMSWLEDRLPLQFPISRPTMRLLSQLLRLVLQRT